MKQSIEGYTLSEDIERLYQWLKLNINIPLDEIFGFLATVPDYIHRFIYDKYSLTQGEQTARSILFIILILTIFTAIGALKTYLECTSEPKSK